MYQRGQLEGCQPGVGIGHVRKEDRERKPVPPLCRGVWGRSPRKY